VSDVSHFVSWDMMIEEDARIPGSWRLTPLPPTPYTPSGVVGGEWGVEDRDRDRDR
jgi:hypothetical protein